MFVIQFCFIFIFCVGFRFYITENCFCLEVEKISKNFKYIFIFGAYLKYSKLFAKMPLNF
ncbi:MAG: hypothetical protein EAZ97_06515 [Bacteroidetes bacterium]|nr:MAG: hypothetical protein EAZ97_06515 [Bacteroidota bacterium]